MAEGDKPQPYTGPIVDAGSGGSKPVPYTGATKTQLEFPDAPSTGRLPLPGLALPFNNGKDIEGNEGLSIGDKAATQFGTLMTDSPQARQEIYAKHLPGVKATDDQGKPLTDKYGNPMIEYKGVKYYTSRPGEFDAMDAGRVALAASASVPAMAIAPASVTGAALASGAITGAQSLSEDALTQAAGGTSQNIDATKAGLSAVVATLVPLGLGKAVLPLAGKLFAAARSGTPLTDEALTKLGLTSSQISSLTPELRDAVTKAARQTFGNQTAAGSAYRGGLSKEFGTDLTRGEITGDPSQIAKEQTLASPGAVPGSGYPRQTIIDNRTTQNQQLSAAQEALRTQAGGGPPLKPEQAGQVLKQGFDNADQAAKANVDQLYTTAKDPAAVVAAGGAPSAPASHVAQVGGVVRADLAQTGAGRAALEDPSLAPNASKALAQLDGWSRGAQPVPTPSGVLGPNGQPIMSVRPGPTQRLDWESIDNQRKMLLQYRETAYGPQGTKTDRDAIDAIINSFDQHFGQLNPLLEQARAAHADRMATFKPGGSPDQDKATQNVLELLQGPEGGAKVVNTIFGSGMKTGEAAQMLDHLNTQVFPTQPAAREVMKEQALRRLVVDAKGDPLSPQKTVTALDAALDGDREGPLYDKLFSKDEMAGLQRFRELQDTIAKSRTPINPPGSGTMVIDLIKHLVGTGIGAKTGALIGAHFGMPDAGMYVGGALGTAVRTIGQRIQAARAINPPANYGVQGLLGKPAMAAGQAAGGADQQGLLGPADRLMQNAWGGP